MPRGQCHRHGARFGPCSCSLGRLSRWVEPTILYLLATGKARYGYEILTLAGEESMTDSEIDPGVVYRTLRQLEDAGCVTSDWEPGEGGPNRRVYEITEVGRAHLMDWVSVLERRAREMLHFVERCHAGVPARGKERID
jgi:PadR family transcriptional regulator, regulatory protein PadR